MDALLCDFNSVLKAARLESNEYVIKVKCSHMGSRVLPEIFQDVHNANLFLPRDDVMQHSS
jgi:hypothetical protein